MNNGKRFDELAKAAAGRQITRRHGLKSLLGLAAAAAFPSLFPTVASAALPSCHSHQECRATYQTELDLLRSGCGTSCSGVASPGCFQACYNSGAGRIVRDLHRCLARREVPCDAASCEKCVNDVCIASCSGGQLCLNGQCVCEPPARLCGFVGASKCCTPQQECTPTIPPVCVDRCLECERWDPDSQPGGACIPNGPNGKPCGDACCGSCQICDNGVCRGCNACETCDSNGTCIGSCPTNCICHSPSDTRPGAGCCPTGTSCRVFGDNPVCCDPEVTSCVCPSGYTVNSGLCFPS